jgi:hypothetical protein
VNTNYYSKYNSNFTASGLLYDEFMALQPIITDVNFEKLLSKEQEENKLMAIKTLSARKRIVSEIKARVNSVEETFWEDFYYWPDREKRLALFFVILKTYKLIMDLHVEVAMKKYKTSGTLDAYDITMRLDKLASENQNVASWSESTLDKINVQYRKVLKDVGLATGNKLHPPRGVSRSFWDYIATTGNPWFIQACFMA